MNNEIVVKYNIGEEEIKLSQAIVRDYLTNGVEVTLPEFKMFTELCKARKLNPFLKEAYIIKYGISPAQIVVGKDAILKRAINHKDFNGREQGVIVQKKDGSLENRKGTFKLPNEALVGGWAKVYRKNWEYPTEITVGFDETAQKKADGSLNKQWETKGATMIEKVALVRALREAFAEELGGMIDESESWNSELIDRSSSHDIKVQKDTLEDETVDTEVIAEATEIDFAQV